MKNFWLVTHLAKHYCTSLNNFLDLKYKILGFWRAFPEMVKMTTYSKSIPFIFILYTMYTSILFALFNPLAAVGHDRGFQFSISWLRWATIMAFSFQSRGCGGPRSWLSVFNLVAVVGHDRGFQFSILWLRWATIVAFSFQSRGCGGPQSRLFRGGVKKTWFLPLLAYLANFTPCFFF